MIRIGNRKALLNTKTKTADTDMKIHIMEDFNNLLAKINAEKPTIPTAIGCTKFPNSGVRLLFW